MRPKSWPDNRLHRRDHRTLEGCRKEVDLLGDRSSRLRKDASRTEYRDQACQEHSDEHAVFLSGNGPLVTVLREALARDECSREEVTKEDASRKVASCIQNIHHFRDQALRDPKPPYKRVVVFDEAQRAWTQDQATKFMHAKRGHSDFNMSEPEFLISVMDRHDDWCVIVCLIGGGQEINTGEAGLLGWSRALKERFTGWDVYLSNRLDDLDFASDLAAAEMLQGPHVEKKRELHLAVSMRFV
jgi:hypothetical protein